MGVAVDHQQVVADIVEFIEVAPALAHLRRGDGAHFFIKNGIAQALRLFDFQLGFRQAHFQRPGNREYRPLLHASLERSRFVNVDHDRFPFGAASPRLAAPILCSG